MQKTRLKKIDYLNNRKPGFLFIGQIEQRNQPDLDPSGQYCEGQQNHSSECTFVLTF